MSSLWASLACLHDRAFCRMKLPVQENLGSTLPMDSSVGQYHIPSSGPCCVALILRVFLNYFFINMTPC
ncbi:hypothetical protein GN956_G4026 [Arapaima gigas]